MGGGRWCLPGGKVDLGDTVEHTVHKEILEETQLVCRECQFLFYQDSPPETPDGMHCINFYFKCSVSGRIRLNKESTAHQWVAPGKLKTLDVAFRNDEGLARFFAP